MNKISVTIIARNEERNILRCLDSVRPFADEIVLVDSMSSDNTAAISRDAGCVVYQREFDGYGSQKQFAVDKASNGWIFSIDADEVVSPELANEILAWKNNPDDDICGYDIPFSLCFMGRIMRHSGVGKEVHLRFFDRRKGQFTNSAVHEGIEISGKKGRFSNRILHYSYRDISHHLEKINTYTSQAAEGYFSRGRRFSKTWAAFKFPVSFFTFYFIKRGILDGWPGFIWSFMAAVYATLKVAKTIELQSR